MMEIEQRRLDLCQNFLGPQGFRRSTMGAYQKAVGADFGLIADHAVFRNADIVEADHLFFDVISLADHAQLIDRDSGPAQFFDGRFGGRVIGENSDDAIGFVHGIRVRCSCRMRIFVGHPPSPESDYTQPVANKVARSRIILYPSTNRQGRAGVAGVAGEIEAMIA